MKNQNDPRIKLDIFQAKTTYQNDYKTFSLRKAQPKIVYDEGKIINKKQEPFQDHETFTRWRSTADVPFNLLWRPKEIIRTDPYQTFDINITEESAYDEQTVKTRPRVYMSPAVSMDDIKDPGTRALLCKNMYTTETAKAIQETAVKLTKRNISNTTYEQSVDPLKRETYISPSLPKELLKSGKSWEDAQVKLTVDPTKTFWLNKDPPVKCGACCDPVSKLVPQSTKDEIHRLIKEDNLRLLHDAPISGYAGYRPEFSGGVPLAKINVPVEHPYMSTSEAITKRYNIKK